MGKSKTPDPTSMDATVRRKLTEEEVADRGRHLAEKLGVVKGLREEKKENADRLAKEIEDRLDECEVLRLEILEGQEESRQGDLFTGGGTEPAEGDPNAPAPAAARGALAEIAARAGDAPAGSSTSSSSSSSKGSAYDFTGDEPTPAPVATNAEVEAAGKPKGEPDKGVH